MAFSGHQLGYTHPHATAKPSTYSGFNEDNQASIPLDPTILNTEAQRDRKNSFATNIHSSNGVISPADSHNTWDHQYPPHQPGPARAAFHDDTTAAFMQHNPVHMGGYGRPSQQWGFDQSSGDCTPITNSATDFMPPPGQFESINPFQPQHHRNDSAFGQQTTVPQSFNVARPEANFVQPSPQVQTPMSPHSHQDYMMMAQQEMENRPMSRRMRPSSPPTTTVDMARRDGIRKKNGRIDIPAERNINTIDALIEKATDDDELKELKQQKRLLRNREAALASRQRKKKHTEDLEVKEKSFMHQINALEKQLADVHMDRQRREQDQLHLMQRCQEAERTIETLHEQMREMKYQHNEETSLLRKRVNFLSEQAEIATAPAMSAAPSSTGFPDFNAEMAALNMEVPEWDDFFFTPETHDEFGLQQPRPPQVLKEKTSTATIVAMPPKKSNDQRQDQPIASGLLFMLLLCGAFVASKQSGGPANASDVPNMPAEVRAAAPAVLNNLLSEASGASMTTQPRHQPVGHEPHPSAQAMAARGQPSRLDQRFHQLTSQTKQQAMDEAFSLSTAEYASLTNPDVPIYNDHEATRPRRTLADTLHDMQHSNRQGSKAELYTRSLLWDQIPVDVVKQFKEMVREHSQIDSRAQIDQVNGDGFKAER